MNLPSLGKERQLSRTLHKDFMANRNIEINSLQFFVKGGHSCIQKDQSNNGERILR